jgi:hypothetical protein
MVNKTYRIDYEGMRKSLLQNDIVKRWLNTTKSGITRNFYLFALDEFINWSEMDVDNLIKNSKETKALLDKFFKVKGKEINIPMIKTLKDFVSFIEKQ